MSNIDLLVCGNSDPGTSGILSPFGKIDGLYFNNSAEPDNYMYDFKSDLSKIMENEDVEYIEINTDNKTDYYRILDELAEFNRSAITVSGTSREELKVIVEKTEEFGKSDDDDTEKEGE